MSDWVQAGDAERLVPAPRRPGSTTASVQGPAAGVLRLQRLAGNSAVTALLAQRQAETDEPPATAGLGFALAEVADSAVPQGDEAAPSVQTAAAEPERPRVQRSGGGVPTVQRVAHRCPAYDGYSAAVSLDAYNCAGLAHRSYDFKSLPATRALLDAGGPGPGAPGQIKHWLWTYTWYLEGAAGRLSPPQADFHTVAGEIGDGPADPTDVYSKNGRRPVYGPGTGPSFRPPARERATRSEPAERPVDDAAGQPIYKVRENMALREAVLSCSTPDAPIQGPPAP